MIKRMGLRFKLSAAFMLLSLFVFVLVGVFANVILEKQFKTYTVAKQQAAIGTVVSRVEGSLQSTDGHWRQSDLESVGVQALNEGMILRVKDSNGTVLWDAWKHNNGMCTQIIRHITSNMLLYDQNFEGGYEETTYPLTVNGESAGSVDVGYYGPYFYSEADIQFLNSLNQFLLIGAAVSFLVCLLLGSYLARRLAQPISRVIDTTAQIAQGDYEGRITQDAGTREIVALTESVNSLAQTLNRQEVLRKQLTADVAHELRTPLATLRSHMEAMIDGVWAPDAHRLQSCHEEILRLTKLVGEMETLSKYESESLTLTKQRFDLKALLQSIALNFESGFKQSGITLCVTGDDAWLSADKDKLSQVFVNLIANAQKYTPEGGRVTVDVAETLKAVIVSVSDTGIGISADDLPYIFERFYRTDRSRTRATGGSGIGLTIAKAIVTAHNGTITVQSAPGLGSTFTVTLPAG